MKDRLIEAAESDRAEGVMLEVCQLGIVVQGWSGPMEARSRHIEMVFWDAIENDEVNPLFAAIDAIQAQITEGDA